MACGVFLSTSGVPGAVYTSRKVLSISTEAGQVCRNIPEEVKVLKELLIGGTGCSRCGLGAVDVSQ